MAVSIALICVLGYLLGGINGAILLSKLVEKDDVRRHGSGNAGFTNFFRNYGKRTSLLVILIDAAKAAVSCLLGGLAATLGHDFPAFLGFRGGKGIVCGFATALVTDWRVGLILLAVFALVYFLTHYVSLASVLCALGLFVSFWLFYPGRPFVLILSGCLSALAIFLHRENINRLVRGQERKTYFFKRGETK